jgi:hypothetical protein
MLRALLSFRACALALGLALLLSGASCPPPSTTDGGVDDDDIEVPAGRVVDVCHKIQWGTLSISGYVGATGFNPQATACRPDDPAWAFIRTGRPGREACGPDDPFVVAMQEALESQTVDFDFGALADCLDDLVAYQDARTTMSDVLGLEDAPVGDLLAIQEACVAAWTPLVEEGGECFQNWDCVEGTFCQPEQLTDPSTIFRCLAPVGEGEVCGTGGSGGLVLRTCAQGLSCEDQVCVREGDEGDACGAGLPCAEGLFCDAMDQCAALAGVDEACSPEAGTCSDDLVCDPATSTCRPRAALGAPCTVDVGCAAQVCVSCRPDEEGMLLCQPKGLSGDPCLAPTDCAGGTCEEGVCVDVPGRLGETCEGAPDDEGDRCTAALAAFESAKVLCDAPEQPADVWFNESACAAAPGDGFDNSAFYDCLIEKFSGTDVGVVCETDAQMNPTAVRQFEDTSQASDPAGCRELYRASPLSLQCAPGFICTDERCAVVEEPTIGEACSESAAPLCRRGRCADGRCRPVAELGDACVPEQCTGGAICEAGTCVALPGEGEACDGRCLPGALCRDNLCVVDEDPLPTEPCTFDSDCGDNGWCDVVDDGDPFADEGTCLAPRAPGEACDRGAQCAGGSCVTSLGECAVTGVGCESSRDLFLLPLLYGVLLLPVGLRRRRRQAGELGA